MADTTGISWTDSTFNPWWGCSKIAPGCDNCYAAEWDKQMGGDYWDPKVDPRITKASNWNSPRKWNKEAEETGVRRRVFCGSMMDWCDIRVPQEVRGALFNLIRETPFLDWQLLTKRASRIEACLPGDWGDNFPHVWLGVTVEDKRYGVPRMRALEKIPARVRFLSCEPLLEDLTEEDDEGLGQEFLRLLPEFHWLIIGGESGPRARPMGPTWVRNLLGEAEIVGVPVWFKQWGGKKADKGGSVLPPFPEIAFPGGELKQWPITALNRYSPWK